MTDMGSPFEIATAAAAELLRRFAVERFDAAVVLGSGWSDVADELGTVAGEVSSVEIPGFPVPTVVGHGTALRRVDVGGKQVLVLAGRVHLYEGHWPSAVVHGVRTAIATGCQALLLTNAAGSLSHELAPGQPVLLADHINLTGQSPLTGVIPGADVPPVFCDLTHAYSPRLRSFAHEVDPTLPNGVYAGLAGPQYETPAEIEMLRRMGADLVGMSTVLETIAARHLGAEVMGVSLVTNLAAGLSPAPLDHAEVLATGASSGSRLAALLRGVIELL